MTKQSCNDRLLRPIRARNDTNRAKKLCLRFLKVRPRSIKEIEDFLKNKGFDKENTVEAVRILKDCGWLNDLTFARLWVGSRIKKPLGKKRLIFELNQKGIDAAIIEQVIGEYFSSKKEEATIEEILKEKIKKTPKGLGKDKIKNKLCSFLLGKGYPEEKVIEIIEKHFI